MRDAAAAAKAAAAQAKAEAKRKEESEKHSRRLAREAAYRAKHPPGHAQCGINWYPAGSGWTHCQKCGQALIYTTDHLTQIKGLLHANDNLTKKVGGVRVVV